MNKILGRLMIAGIGALCAGGVRAQGDTVATLQVDKGVVMVSTGGEYVSAPTGQPLVSGERVMITDGAATVRYGNGCTRTFTMPGVYTIDGTCAAAGDGQWSTPGVVAAVVAGTVATGVVVHNITHDEHPRPISR